MRVPGVTEESGLGRWPPECSNAKRKREQEATEQSIIFVQLCKGMS